MKGPTRPPRPPRLRHPLVERVGYHLARARAWARRATALGVGIRGAIWATGCGALVLALPPSLWTGPVLLVAAAVAVAPAAAPGGGWVSLVELAAVAAVAVAAANDAPPPLAVILVLAALLYLHHTAAALGAQLRTDTVVRPAVLRHWAVRAGVVVAGSAALSLGVVTAAEQPPRWSVTASIGIGVAAAVAVAAALIWLVNRRTGPEPGRDSGHD